MRGSQTNRVAQRIGRLKAQVAPDRTGLLSRDPEAAADKRAAEEYLYEFVKQAWHVLEPRAPFVENWHIELLCRKLEKMTGGKIKNLLVNVPPGTMKSLLISVFWPAWEWGPAGQPWRRYLFSAYGAHLSIRDNSRARRLMKSEWYQERWGDVFKFRQEVSAKVRYENDAMGMRLATSVGAAATGERADTVVFDDPHKLESWNRPKEIAQAINHKNGVLSSRGIGDDSRKVIMQQRVTYRDVTFDTLKKMDQGGTQWEIVILPMTYDPNFKIKVGKLEIGPHPEDPREPGELLVPELQGPQYVHELRIDLGERAAAVLEQNPKEKMGAVFLRKDLLSCFRVKKDGVWWYVLLDPEGGDRFYREDQIWKLMSVDFATSLEETADFTSIGIYAVTPDDDLLFVDHVHERIAGPDIVPAVWGVYRQHRPAHVLMEKAGFQLSEIQRAYREGLPVIPMTPAGRDKFMRSVPAQSRVRRHKFFVDEDLHDREVVIEELVTFPDPNRHDDIVDQFSYAAEALTLDLRALSTAAYEELSAASTSYQQFAGPFGPGYSVFGSDDTTLPDHMAQVGRYHRW